jgi:hypothetical protein
MPWNGTSTPRQVGAMRRQMMGQEDSGYRFGGGRVVSVIQLLAHASSTIV